MRLKIYVIFEIWFKTQFVNDDDIQYSESSSSTDCDCLEQERLQREHSFAWKPPEDFKKWDE